MTEILERRSDGHHRFSAFGRFFTERAAIVDFSDDSVVLASNPAELVLVEIGALDLFAAEVTDGRPVGRWTPLCRLQAGAVLGLGAPAGPRHSVIGRPVPGSVISRIDMAQVRGLGRAGPVDRLGTSPLHELEAAEQLVAGIDSALSALERSLRLALPPREFTAVEPTDEVLIRRSEVVRSVAGVQWVDVLSGVVTAGEAGSAGRFAAGDRVCITELDWLTAADDSRLRVRPSGSLLASGELFVALVLHAFRFAYAVDRTVERLAVAREQALQRQREHTALSDRRTEKAFNTLLSESSRQRSTAGPAHESTARRALWTVAVRKGVTLVAPAAHEPGTVESTGDDRTAVAQIAAASGLPTRTVRLVGRWWQKDSGPLVGYRRTTGSAVALVRDERGYLLLDPDVAAPQRVDKSVAVELKIEATMLYRVLPTTVSGIGSLLRFGAAGTRAEAQRFLLVALAVAVIGLLVPILTGAILGVWVPAGQHSLVVQGAVLIMASSLLVAGLTIVQNTAVLRLEGQLDLTMQAAIWARVLALPMDFFARYAAAELGTITLGISTVRETLSSVSTIAALGLVTGLVNLALLFWYSLSLGLIALAMVSVGALVSLALTRRGVRSQRVLYASEKKLSSLTYQFLSGLSTLRLAAAEDRAYTRWSQVLSDNLRSSLAVRRSQAAITVFNAGLSIICSLAIFGLVGGPLHGVIGTAAFLSFFTAFNQVLGSLVQFCSAAAAAMAVVPMLEGVSPILLATPEVSASMAQPGDLDGSIAVRDVSFRYGGDGPLVLDNVSFDVGAGEFVAVVGATGSGKSTILRLLLGFEQPLAGSILFDGQDMRRLDITALRRQCGVVLQNGSLLAGDVATNIIAGTGHTIEDAWKAAELAGMADDIRAMPMGMHTVIPEGGSTLSGGQRQRLMIARALISSPRMLFFDEATSALDNETQRIVTESTRRLNASRVVIAHRLSTVEHADRIIVLDAGRVIQIGSYRELLDDPDGAFSRLVRRQMIDPGGRE